MLTDIFVVTTRRMLLLLLGKGQGCCWPFYSAQAAPSCPATKNYCTWDVSRGEGLLPEQWWGTPVLPNPVLSSPNIFWSTLIPCTSRLPGTLMVLEIKMTESHGEVSVRFGAGQIWVKSDALSLGDFRDKLLNISKPQFKTSETMGLQSLPVVVRIKFM